MTFSRTVVRPPLAFAVLTAAVVLAASGCGGGSTISNLYGFFPFGVPVDGDTGGGNTPGANVGGGGTGGLGGGSRAATDPCTESQTRKFVRLALRNQAPDDYVHYFLVMIAFVQSDIYPEGAVCPDDIDLYTQFGYTEIRDGADVAFGSYCITGPALFYFHRSGQFQGAGGQLAAAIAPAQGASPTYDSFFNSAGAQVPVPDLILFHNPGTGAGAPLLISQPNTQPCNIVFTGGEALCLQDAFYYVDDRDQLAGSTALGFGSGRRTPSEIQGTGCECIGIDDASWVLAPGGTSAGSARCNEFLRGGRIELAFLRNDQDPPFPQAVWRVTDAAGSLVHTFDTRSGF